MENRRPRSSQTVTVSLGEETLPDAASSAPANSTARPLQYELSECVETKTVTTTTTTKRTFPTLFVREPRPIESLDARDYPLALAPIPAELLTVSFDVPRGDTSGHGQRVQERSKALARIDTNASGANSPVEAGAASRSSRKPSSKDQTAPATRSRASHRQPATDGLRRSLAHTSRNTAPSERPRLPNFLATPDATDMAGGSRLQSLGQNMPDNRAGRAPSYDVTSPTDSDFQTAFGGSVATPPIDVDAEVADMDDSLQESIRSSQHRPTIDIVAAQDAALPSPRLSPTLASANAQQSRRKLFNNGGGDDQDDDFSNPVSASSGWMDNAAAQMMMEDGDALGLVHTPTRATTDSLFAPGGGFNAQTMIEAFDLMPNQMQTFMMYQLLRRCTRSTIRMVGSAVIPVLKRDFFRTLPVELRHHIMSYLDVVDLCRAAQVSKHWRLVVDCNETGWKELFDRDGFQLETGELERAITQGWGWQDPYGTLEHERDLLAEPRAESRTAEETESRAESKTAEEADPTTERGSRTSKRKREETSSGPSGRSKRRAAALETSRATDSKLIRVEGGSADRAYKVESSADRKALVRLNPAEGPMSAANAAAMAIPDPGPALNDKFPALRRMHLYKTLYRRHHMIRCSWTDGNVVPGHIAFAAHPRHVITCLQFDEDKVITGSDDMQIHIYDTKTGELRKRLEGHEGGVWALQYEGNTLVSGSTDRSVRVWNIEKGICTHVLYAHTSTVRCLQILMPAETGDVDAKGKPIMLPTEPLIITGSRDHSLRVWALPPSTDTPHSQEGQSASQTDCPYYRRTLSGHTNSVRAISAHGDTLVSGSYDGTVRVWRISTGEERHVLSGHIQKVYSVVMDPKRNRCVSGSMDSFVKIWDLDTGACLHTLEGHSLLVGLLDLKDERLVSAAADSTLRVWDPENGRCKNVLTAHTGAITCFQHDGQKIISGSDKAVKMWDIVSGDCIHDLLTDLGGVWQVKFNHRRCVAAVQRDGITYLEILDFGALRDGMPASQLGVRRVLNEEDAQRIRTEDAGGQQPQQAPLQQQ